MVEPGNEGKSVMAGRRVLPDDLTLLRLADKMTHQEIADLYGTTRQAVSYRLSRLAESTARRRDWPWEVQARHRKGWLYEALSYYLASRDRELTERQQQRLSSLMEMLKQLPGDYVVDYYPDTAAGFRLRERRPTDDPTSLLAVPTRDNEQRQASVG